MSLVAVLSFFPGLVSLTSLVDSAFFGFGTFCLRAKKLNQLEEVEDEKLKNARMLTRPSFGHGLYASGEEPGQ